MKSSKDTPREKKGERCMREFIRIVRTLRRRGYTAISWFSFFFSFPPSLEQISHPYHPSLSHHHHHLLYPLSCQEVHLFFAFSSTSSPNSSGLLGSTYALSLESPHLAPIVTQTCFIGPVTFLVSLQPVHLILFSRDMSLFPSPPLADHSLITSRMNVIFSRNWLAEGIFCNAAGISGRRREVEVLVMVERDGDEKLRRVCKG